ncbi:MAG TPA: hypothetical protein VHV31_04460, partial [Nitrolancea sp.]|nr:hypothetical protein [Nitrolancea sp.]
MRVDVSGLRSRRATTSVPDVIRGISPGVVILLIAVIASLTLSSYGQFLGITAVTTAMVAMSVGIVTGRTGMISLCQMSFAALGEWALLWLNDHAPGMPFLVDVL